LDAIQHHHLQESFNMSFNPQVQDKVTYELTDEGLYPARLARVIELGTQTDKYGTKPKVVLGFLVPSLTVTVDGEEKQKMVFTSKFGMNVSANPDATLMKYVNAIASDATHMKDMLGKPCMIEIKHTKPNSEGVQYANIANVTKPMHGLAIAEPDCDVYMFEADAPDKAVWDKLSEYRQEDIKKADNWELMMSKMSSPEPALAPADFEGLPF
jgi:hypothetical protein